MASELPIRHRAIPLFEPACCVLGSKPTHAPGVPGLFAARKGAAGGYATVRALLLATACLYLRRYAPPHPPVRHASGSPHRLCMRRPGGCARHPCLTARKGKKVLGWLAPRGHFGRRGWLAGDGMHAPAFLRPVCGVALHAGVAAGGGCGARMGAPAVDSPRKRGSVGVARRWVGVFLVQEVLHCLVGARIACWLYELIEGAFDVHVDPSGEAFGVSANLLELVWLTEPW